MLRLLLRFVINGFAIWVAAELIPGVILTDDPLGIALVAVVFGLINAFLRPVALLFGLPFIIVTLGLFALVINAGLFALTAWFTEALALAGFWPAFWGALLVSLISWFLGEILGAKKKKET